MALSKEFVDHLGDLFAGVAGTEIRRMFGGVGIFRQGLMYALATSEGRIALKADAETAERFRAEGSSEWTYAMPGRPAKSMGYWYMPERLADDPDELREWAQAAFAAALRADAAKPPKQRKWKG
ncbi:MAG: competence protein TfoX [Alphaproteobacteria bacterium]|nr:MAG: competence protein TfoX [Alphaproteobacteria bacterium]